MMKTLNLMVWVSFKLFKVKFFIRITDTRPLIADLSLHDRVNILDPIMLFHLLSNSIS